ncbi:RNA-directed DNA polymerase [Sutterella seckii]|uniref:RNA-directed DNA polymerase n=1 Tax=Sutterella seckii TaxID=1944635 RepID=A0A6I1EKU4_9BURK|nr:RNA-directed DNA polymerase [Sutterella seckii]
MHRYIIGWFNFYKLAQFKGWAREIDQWIRRRIRMIYWKRWKKIRTKYETLKKRGIDKQKAWEWANTSKKYWRVACSPILHLALGDAFLEKQGWTWIGLAGAPVEWSAC